MLFRGRTLKDAADQGHHPIFNVVYKWLDKDPMAANQWLASQPANSPRALRIKPAGEDRN